MSAPISPLLSLATRSYEASVATNKRRAMNTINKSSIYDASVRSASRYLLMHGRGFLSSMRAEAAQLSSLHFPPSFRVQSPASGRAVNGRPGPAPALWTNQRPPRWSAANQRRVLAEVRVPHSGWSRAAHAPCSALPAPGLADVCPDYTRVPAWLSVWIEN